MKKFKRWLKENGIEGAAGLIVTVLALYLGWWFVFWGSLGFLVGKNSEIIKNLWKNKYKDIVEDFVDDVGDKIRGK